MAYQEADALHGFFIDVSTGKQPAYLLGSFLFLIFAHAGAVFCLGRLNADVMH